ncbi:hypothetical protein H310_15333 [Aphanomyces invadans]|uniref:Transposase n=1 Tax=Aphanomyces invadans TaxID=157072 RepID=A0A024T7K4_9STRA|nr:hypothetical protein H310_15333 [Aphanomyces invadans]ETV89828.1 hypothetical protein H310_15333 [Aphanomyces invadans]|eukprot:XP_008881540.1 hypothetical protein H310_15333 [Aphanomyces invadans]
MLDMVHIDEKWFFFTQVNRKYYLWKDEPHVQGGILDDERRGME